MLRSKQHLFQFVTLIQECEYESKTTVNQSLTCQLKDVRNKKEKKRKLRELSYRMYKNQNHKYRMYKNKPKKS